MKNSNGPWKSEEEKRACFIEAFGMVGRTEKEIDEARRRLEEYVRLVVETYGEIKDRGGLRNLQERIENEGRLPNREGSAVDRFG